VIAAVEHNPVGTLGSSMMPAETVALKKGTLEAGTKKK